MKKLIVLALAAFAVAAAAFAGPVLAAGKTINVGDDWFVKKGKAPTLTVKAGTALTFKWVGKVPHDAVVTSGPAKFRSGIKTRGTYKVTVKKRGTYKIVCTIHQPGMKMTLKVK